MSDPITVRFDGICTHHLSKLGGRSRHRVVLVRAHEDTHIWDKTIPPHIPKLRIRKDFIDGTVGPLDGLRALDDQDDWKIWQITGANLELEEVTSEPYVGRLDGVLHLASRGDKLDPAKVDVLVHEQAACYFDVDRGEMTAATSAGGAVYTELRVATDPSRAPKLKVTSFGTHVPSWITLKPGAHIGVEHIGSVAGDSPYDFLLHYLIFPEIPDDVVLPDEDVEYKKQRKAQARSDNDISAGCSNSQYP